MLRQLESGHTSKTIHGVEDGGIDKSILRPSIEGPVYDVSVSLH